MARVAIVHFTGPPAIGGIESLMAAQAEALLSDGHEVRIVVGSGDDLPGTETIRLPELHPNHERIRDGRSALSSWLPTPDHPLVTRLSERLCEALAGFDHMWVHNAFTVYLNPFLTVALYDLPTRLPAAWCAWCADLTPVSSFQQALTPRDEQLSRRAPPGVRYVAPSRARQLELELYLRPHPSVCVIPPPLRLGSWLGLHECSLRLLESLGIAEAGIVVLVPAKLLPHKGLERAVSVAEHLHRLDPRSLVLLSAAPSPHEAALSERVREMLQRNIFERGMEDVVRLLSDSGRPAISPSTLRDLMLLSDAVFVPSYEEGFGMPLLEAAALRVPVVCSELPAYSGSELEPAARFALDLDDGAVASMIRDVALTPASRAKRAALRSWPAFRAQLRELLRTADPG